MKNFSYSAAVMISALSLFASACVETDGLVSSVESKGGFDAPPSQANPTPAADANAAPTPTPTATETPGPTPTSTSTPTPTPTVTTPPQPGDTTAPSISSVSGPSAATYLSGQNLEFTMTLSEAVNVTGSPRLVLTVGSATKYAAYLSGSGSSSLKFRYTVASGDADGDGISLSGSVDLNGGAIKDGSSNALSPLSFSAPSLASVLVDGAAPSISSVTAPANATYIAGQDLNFTVNFSEAVTISGSPRLVLTIGSTTRYAAYVPGGTTSVVFRYTVVDGEVDSDGIAMNASIDLNGGSIKDAATNDLSPLSFSAPSLAGVKVNATSPGISAMTGPADATYITGQNLDFTATISKAVTVTGTPRLALTIGSTTKYANYLSGSGTSTLVFRYTVAAGDFDSDGIDVSTSLDLNSGTIKDGTVALSPLTFAAPALGGVKVDAVAPTISSVTAPANKTYGKDQTLDFTVNFSEAVNVTATPRLTLTIGSTTRYANYLSGTGTNALIFRYTIVSGDNDSNGITMSSPLGLPTGAAIKDLAGIDLSPLTFTPPSMTGVLVDTVLPDVAIQSPASLTAGKTGITVGGKCDAGFPVTIYGDVDQESTGTCTGSVCQLPGCPGTFSVDVTFSAGEGAKVVNAKQVDAAGNEKSDPRTFMKDSTGPTLTIDTPVSSGTTGTLTIGGACESATGSSNVTIEGPVSGQPLSTACSSNRYSQAITLTGGDGTKAILVKQSDALGNAGSASRDFSMDGTAPAVPSALSLVMPAASPGNMAEPVIRVSGVVSGDTVSLHADSGCTIPALKASAVATDTTIDLTSSALPAGSYDFYAKSTDAAGNASTCSTAKVTYVYDNTAPSAPNGLALVTPASSPGKVAAPVIRVSGVTSGDTISLHSDSACSTTAKASATAAGATVDLTSASLAEAAYTFYAKAVDAAGNASSCSTASVAYTYDNTAPSAPSELTLITPASSPGTVSTPVIRVGGVVSGDTISLHTDSSCATAAKASSAATGATIDLTSSALPGGVYAFYAKATDAAGNASSCSAASAAYTYQPNLTCGTNFIKVPGDATLGTTDFCVSKFEMKALNGSGTLIADGAGTWVVNGCDDGCGTISSCYTSVHDPATTSAASRPDGTPWTNISRTNAAAECAALGAGYALISNAQWQTIARNIESTASNWTGNSVGSGNAYIGHSDYAIDANAVAQGLAAATDSKALAASSGSVPLNDASGFAGTGQASGTQRRTHTLSNGNVIWDFGGNVREWVSDNINTTTYGLADQFSFELPTTNNAKLHFGPSGTYGVDPGFGKAYLSTGGGAVFRGGYYADTTAGVPGVFMVDGGTPATSSALGVGFRCVQQ